MTCKATRTSIVPRDEARQEIVQLLCTGFHAIFCLAGEEPDSDFLRSSSRTFEEEAETVIGHTLRLLDLTTENFTSAMIEANTVRPGSVVQRDDVQALTADGQQPSQERVCCSYTLALGLRKVTQRVVGGNAPAEYDVKVLIKPEIMV